MGIEPGYLVHDSMMLTSKPRNLLWILSVVFTTGMQLSRLCLYYSQMQPLVTLKNSSVNVNAIFSYMCCTIESVSVYKKLWRHVISLEFHQLKRVYYLGKEEVEVFHFQASNNIKHFLLHFSDNVRVPRALKNCIEHGFTFFHRKAVIFSPIRFTNIF